MFWIICIVSTLFPKISSLCVGNNYYYRKAYNCILRGKLFRNQIKMKRYFQTINNEGGSNNSESQSGIKKPRRVFQPLDTTNEAKEMENGFHSETVTSLSSEVVVSNSVLPKEETNTIIKASSITTSTRHSSAVTSNPLTLDPSLFLLTDEDRHKAQTIPPDQWIFTPNLLVKLSSKIDNATRKGVIALDMDGTIIVTKSGKTFATNKTDWKLFDSSIGTKLLQVYEEGYSLAVISNQKGVKNRQDQLDIQEKFDSILKLFAAVPIDVICSHKDDVFRKPIPGMWEFLYEARWKHFLTPLSKENCIYVGDAAGRPQQGTRKKDFSDTDYKLALNVGIQFQTPEKFFLNSTQKLHLEFPIPENPLTRLLHSSPSHEWDESLFTSSALEIVLLVAAPASGKSTLAREFVRRGYTRVNQDELKDLNACLRVGRTALTKQTNLVVDNTNLNPAARLSWLQLAKELNVKIRCIVLNTPKEICMLLSAFRLADPSTLPEDRRKIETVVFHKFFKDPVFPKVSDGYERVDILNWSPKLPESPRSKRLFSMYIH